MNRLGSNLVTFESSNEGSMANRAEEDGTQRII